MVSTILEIAVAATAVGTLGATAGALTVFEHFAAAAAFNGVVSYAQTGSIGLGLRTAAFTLMSEYAWAETGSALGGVKGEIANPVKASLVHGMVGGSLNAIEGGSFKNGFLSAAVSEALTGPVENIKISGEQNATIMARGLASGVVGGTVAAATGGNFENGMMTSAMAEIFNSQDKNGESNIGKMWSGLVADLTPSEDTIYQIENDMNAIPGGAEFVGGARLLEEAGEGVEVGAKAVAKYWPENDGFLGEASQETLAPGTMIDRYGEPGGSFASPAGTPFEMRALPGEATDRPYYAYRVEQPIGVLSGLISPGFGRLGLGTQYKFSTSMQSLVDQGYLKEVG